MRYAVIYSSLTGNTKQVAEAICSVLPEDSLLLPVEEAASVSADVYFIGCWVDKGTADEKTRQLLSGLQGQKVALFSTLGAFPFSKTSFATHQRIWELAAEQNDVLGCFVCQGRIAPDLKERFKKLPPGDSHYMDEAAILRFAEADLHPNALDLTNARDYARAIVQHVLGAPDDYRPGADGAADGLPAGSI